MQDEGYFVNKTICMNLLFDIFIEKKNQVLCAC